MDRVCNYSTIIFASNVTVLILVAIVTDYWQHRSFDFEFLIKEIDERNVQTRLKHQGILPHHDHTNRTGYSRPVDTDSYLVLHHRYMDDLDQVYPPWIRRLPNNFTIHYEPPILLQQHYIFTPAGKKLILFDKIHLFTEYGSLFRDCLAVEGGIMDHLPIPDERKHRCFSFLISQREKGNFINELKEIPALEKLGFSFACLAFCSSCVSLWLGAHGNLKKRQTAMIGASVMSLVSGFTLTLGISLYHGKCHVLNRRPLAAGLDLQLRDLLQEARKESYGWSFSLAWICVPLNFVSCAMWLHAADDRDESARILNRFSFVHERLLYEIGSRRTTIKQAKG